MIMRGIAMGLALVATTALSHPDVARAQEASVAATAKVAVVDVVGLRRVDRDAVVGVMQLRVGAALA
ncbi:MAG: hypothetical protein AAB426_00765, partial [Myxococcota bacterium]